MPPQSVAAVVTAAFLATIPAAGPRASEPAAEPVVIGSRLEPFVDMTLIDRLEGTTLRLHEPVRMPLPRSPLVGGYLTVIKDGDLFRAVYRSTVPSYGGERYDGDPGDMTCYAESRDGHEWTFPKLGLVEVDGRSDNNVILHASPFSHNFSPFLDARPGVPAGERFKALAGLSDQAVEEVVRKVPGAAPGVRGGLHAFVSPDCIRWRRLAQEPVIRIPDYGFDSQNVVFWSPAEDRYVCCFRSWRLPAGAADDWRNKLRSVNRSTSADFRTWSAPVPLDPNVPGEHLYTNQTHPYFRAPHVLVALPTRFMPDRGDSTEIILMSARPLGRKEWHYERPFMQAFMRPGLDPDRWGNRSNYAALNVAPTGPDEMSIWHARSGHRYVLRTDGFASVSAGSASGRMVTKPIVFTGGQLVINAATAASGDLRCEIQSAEGQALEGLALDDCIPFVGDAIERILTWRDARGAATSDLAALAGRPVRLRFELRDADLYSIRFQERPGQRPH